MNVLRKNSWTSAELNRGLYITLKILENEQYRQRIMPIYQRCVALAQVSKPSIMWSYARQDQATHNNQLSELYQSTINRLMDSGIEVKYDLYNSCVGNDPVEFMRKGVQDSDYALMAIDETYSLKVSNDTPHQVKREVEYIEQKAVGHLGQNRVKYPVIPVLFEGDITEVCGFLKQPGSDRDFRYSIYEFNALDNGRISWLRSERKLLAAICFPECSREPEEIESMWHQAFEQDKNLKILYSGLSKNETNMISEQLVDPNKPEIVFAQDARITDFSILFDRMLEDKQSNINDSFSSKEFREQRVRQLKNQLTVLYRKEINTIPNTFSQHKSIKKDYIDLEIKNDLDDAGDSSVSVRDFFSTRHPVDKVLLVGEPGVGKTVALQRMIHEWCDVNLWPDLDLVVYATANKLKSMKNFYSGRGCHPLLATVSGIINENRDPRCDPEFSDRELDSLLKQVSPEKALLVIDGFDELHPRDGCYDAISNLVQSNRLPFRILVGSRLNVVQSSDFDRVFRCVGYSQASVRKYVNNFFSELDKEISALNGVSFNIFNKLNRLNYQSMPGLREAHEYMRLFDYDSLEVYSRPKFTEVRFIDEERVGVCCQMINHWVSESDNHHSVLLAKISLPNSSGASRKDWHVFLKSKAGRVLTRRVETDSRYYKSIEAAVSKHQAAGPLCIEGDNREDDGSGNVQVIADLSDLFQQMFYTRTSPKTLTVWRCIALNDSLQTFSRIPIVLEFICAIFEEKLSEYYLMDLETHLPLSLTDMYQQVYVLIQKRFLEKIGHAPLDPNSARRFTGSHQSPAEVEASVAAHYPHFHDYLTELSYRSYLDNRTSLSHEFIMDHDQIFIKDHQFVDYDQLRSYRTLSGLFQGAYRKEQYDVDSYQFIHKSVQEYLVAKYLANRLMLTDNAAAEQEVKRFVEAHLHRSQARLVLQFLSGLLSCDPALLNKFFSWVDDQPRQVNSFMTIVPKIPLIEESFDQLCDEYKKSVKKELDMVVDAITRDGTGNTRWLTQYVNADYFQYARKHTLNVLRKAPKVNGLIMHGGIDGMLGWMNRDGFITDQTLIESYHDLGKINKINDTNFLPQARVYPITKCLDVLIKTPDEKTATLAAKTLGKLSLFHECVIGLVYNEFKMCSAKIGSNSGKFDENQITRYFWRLLNCISYLEDGMNPGFWQFVTETVIYKQSLPAVETSKYFARLAEQNFVGPIPALGIIREGLEDWGAYQQLAVEACKRLRGISDTQAGIVSALQRLLVMQPKNQSIDQCDIIEALGNCGKTAPDSSVESLLPLVNSKDVQVRCAAIEALSELGYCGEIAGVGALDYCFSNIEKGVGHLEAYSCMKMLGNLKNNQNTAVISHWLIAHLQDFLSQIDQAQYSDHNLFYHIFFREMVFTLVKSKPISCADELIDIVMEKKDHPIICAFSHEFWDPVLISLVAYCHDEHFNHIFNSIIVPAASNHKVLQWLVKQRDDLDQSREHAITARLLKSYLTIVTSRADRDCPILDLLCQFDLSSHIESLIDSYQRVDSELLHHKGHGFFEKRASTDLVHACIMRLLCAIDIKDLLLFYVENPSQPLANAIKLQALKHQVRITKEDGLLCYSGLDEQIHEFNFSEDLRQKIEMQLFDLKYEADLSKDFGNSIKK